MPAQSRDYPADRRRARQSRISLQPKAAIRLSTQSCRSVFAAFHISTRVAAAASMFTALTTIASQRANLWRRDEFVEISGSTSARSDDLPPSSKELCAGSVTESLMLKI